MHDRGRRSSAVQEVSVYSICLQMIIPIQWNLSDPLYGAVLISGISQHAYAVFGTTKISEVQISKVPLYCIYYYQGESLWFLWLIPVFACHIMV